MLGLFSKVVGPCLLQFEILVFYFCLWLLDYTYSYYNLKLIKSKQKEKTNSNDC